MNSENLCIVLSGVEVSSKAGTLFSEMFSYRDFELRLEVDYHTKKKLIFVSNYSHPRLFSYQLEEFFDKTGFDKNDLEKFCFKLL